MRVSSTQIAESSLLGIMNAYSRFDIAQGKVNTGRQLQKPSDDPSGTAQTLNFRQSVSELVQYGKTMDQAKGFMSTAESALDSVSALLRQARTFAVQGASDNVSSETRQALAGQIQDIITQLGNLGNTTFGARYVFAGQRTSSPPFQASGSGFAYTGGTKAAGDGDIVLDIGRGEALTINATGDNVFSPLIQPDTPGSVGPPPVAPTKSILSQIRDDINFGGSASGTLSRTDIAELDDQINKVLAVRADLGSKIQRIDLTQQRNSQTQVNFTRFISDIEDADIPKAMVELQTAQTAYQAALQSTARAFQSSLLDFLKQA